MRVSYWLLPKDIAEGEGVAGYSRLKKQVAGPQRNQRCDSRRVDFFKIVVNLDQSRSRSGGMLLSRGDQQGTFDDDRKNNSLRNGSCIACRYPLMAPHP